MADATRLLEAMGEGDPKAAGELLPLVYQELRRLAQAKMNQEVMGEMEGLARYEVPKKIALLEHDFSIERGELTPTLKVKRRVIDRTYKQIVDSLYQDEHEPAGV